MDVVVGDSRGRGFVRYFKYRWTASLIWRKGATTHQLLPDVDKLLNQNRNNASPHHVFFITGITDLTTRLINPSSNPSERYEEVIFNDTPDQALTRMSTIFKAAAEYISTHHHAIASFATITPMSIKEWNHSRLLKKATSYLEYENQYSTMQDNLIQSITLVNKFIINFNDKNKMPTARLARKIIKKSGKKRKTHRVYYTRLPDGVHPDDVTAEEWIDIQSMTMLEARHPQLFENGHYQPLATSSTSMSVTPPSATISSTSQISPASTIITAAADSQINPAPERFLTSASPSSTAPLPLHPDLSDPCSDSDSELSCQPGHLRSY